jgi:hypothetical protein
MKHPPQLHINPPKAPPNTVGLGFDVKTLSVQPSHKESDSHVSMRPNNNPRELVKTPQVFLQANKSSAPGTLSSSRIRV